VADTPESKVKDAVKKILKKFGVHYFMPVQTGKGTRHLDFICCCWGYYLAIETKVSGKLPSPMQDRTINTIRASQGAVLVITESNTNDLTDWLAWRQPWSNKPLPRCYIENYQTKTPKVIDQDQ
jgi:hypothetical protein